MSHRNVSGKYFHVCGNYATILEMSAARLDDGQLLIFRRDPRYTDKVSFGNSWVLEKLMRCVDIVRDTGRISDLTHLHLGPRQALDMYLTGDLPHLAFRRAVEGVYDRSHEAFPGNRPFIDLPFSIARRKVTLRISSHTGTSYAGFNATDKNEVSLLS